MVGYRWQKDELEALRAWFESIDADRDGKISHYEEKQSSLDGLIDVYDLGKVGYLTYDGLKRSLDAQRAQRPKETREFIQGLKESHKKHEYKRDYCEGLHAYKATDAKQLSFDKGDTIFVMSKHDRGWWRGRIIRKGSSATPPPPEGNTGYFPNSYTKPTLPPPLPKNFAKARFNSPFSFNLGLMKSLAEEPTSKPKSRPKSKPKSPKTPKIEGFPSMKAIATNPNELASVLNSLKNETDLRRARKWACQKGGKILKVLIMILAKGATPQAQKSERSNKFTTLALSVLHALVCKGAKGEDGESDVCEQRRVQLIQKVGVCSFFSAAGQDFQDTKVRTMIIETGRQVLLRSSNSQLNTKNLEGFARLNSIALSKQPKSVGALGVHAMSNLLLIPQMTPKISASLWERLAKSEGSTLGHMILRALLSHEGQDDAIELSSVVWEMANRLKGTMSFPAISMFPSGDHSPATTAQTLIETLQKMVGTDVSRSFMINSVSKFTLLPNDLKLCITKESLSVSRLGLVKVCSNINRLLTQLDSKTESKERWSKGILYDSGECVQGLAVLASEYESKCERGFNRQNNDPTTLAIQALNALADKAEAETMTRLGNSCSLVLSAANSLINRSKRTLDSNDITTKENARTIILECIRLSGRLVLKTKGKEIDVFMKDKKQLNTLADNLCDLLAYPYPSFMEWIAKLICLFEARDISNTLLLRCTEHKNAGMASEAIAKCFNKPDEDTEKAVIKFLQAVYDSGNESFFAQSDQLVLFQIMVHKIEELRSFPSEPILLSLFECYHAMLQWEDYPKHLPYNQQGLAHVEETISSIEDMVSEKKLPKDAPIIAKAEALRKVLEGYEE